MKIIEEYLKTLYKNDKSNEIKELKEELREHLITSTNEFIEQGYLETEAQHKAIEQFDGGKEMLKELHRMLKKSKIINVKVSKIFKSITFVSIIIFGLLFFYLNQVEKHYMSLESTIETEIEYLSQQYDMTKIDEYDIEKVLDKKETYDVRSIEIRVADMEEGNTDLNPDKKLFHLVYESVTDKEQKELLNNIGLGGQSILDKDGNVVHYQFSVDKKSESIVFPIFITSSFIGCISLICYFILKLNVSVNSNTH